MTRRWMLSILLFLVGFGACAMPAYAVPWKEYSNKGPVGWKEPGGFSFPMGAATDSDGNLYVAEDAIIMKLDASTGEWSKFGNGAGTGLGQFSRPTGITVDVAGNVYVTDSTNHKVQKYTASTGEWSEWGKPGAQSGTAPGEFYFPLDVAVDSAGNVYVVENGNHRLQKYTLAEGSWTVIGTRGSSPGQFYGPNGIFIDGDDNVYVADSLNNRVQKFTASTGEWSAWGKPGNVQGSGLGEFAFPSAVAVDSEGNVYVTERDSHRVQIRSASTGEWSELGIEGEHPGVSPVHFKTPLGIAVDGDGNIFVVDNFRVLKYASSTGAWSQWAKIGPVSGTQLGQFSSPFGVAIDADGNLYVADVGNHRVQKLTAATGEWSEWGKGGGVSGNGLGEFNSPTDVAVDRHGNVYVADKSNHRIQVLDAETGLWSAWGSGGTELGQFKNPTGIAVDGDGNVYVADANNYRVQVRSSATGEWSLLGTVGYELGQFLLPSDVEVDADGNVYVADTGNQRVQKYTAATGEWIEWKKTGGGSGTGAGEFNNPSGIAADWAGNLYVADKSNYRVQKLSAATGEWSVLGGNGIALGEFAAPAGVAVDAAGNVYVADTSNHRIQILSMPGAPTALSATAGDGAVEISFAAPANAEDSGVTGYTVTANPGGITVSGASGPITVTGLTNGVTYTFTVTAVSGYGISLPSGELTATPQVPAPGAPVLETPVAGNAQVTLKWKPVEGSDGYQVFLSESASSEGAEDDDAAPEFSVTDDVYSSVVTGLTNGTTYYFVVKAVNAGGESPASNQVSAVPFTVPDAPTGVTAVAGDGKATVAFAAPANSGGSPVTSYEVTASSGDVATGTSSPIVVTGLTNGTSYTFTVKAINAAGPSLPSAVSNAVVPTAPPVDDDDGDDNGEDNGDDNDGGDSSAGSDPSAAPAASNSGAEILVNGKAESAGIVTTTVQDGRTVTTVAVDESRLEAMLAAEGRQAAVTIPVNDPEADIIAGELTGRMVKGMEDKQAVLEIRTGRATYTLPASQINIDAVSAQLGEAVALEDIKVRIEIAAPTAEALSAAERAAAEASTVLVAPPVQFTVTADYDGKTVEVAKFDDYVERMIAIPDGVDRDRITTGVVIDPDGTVRHVPTQVVNVDGTYYARINSLTNSTYAVVWHPVEFADMANHWAEKNVNDMGSRMVVDGDGDGTFGPDRSITRAEFAAVMVRALGLGPERGEGSFSDVTGSERFADAVHAAAAYGLVTGFEDGSFRPDERITREQAMVILAKAMALTNLREKLSARPPEEALATFRDVADVSGWALAGIADSVEAGLVTGVGGERLAPKAALTRVEAAVLASRLLSNAGLI